MTIDLYVTNTVTEFDEQKRRQFVTFYGREQDGTEGHITVYGIDPYLYVTVDEFEEKAEFVKSQEGYLRVEVDRDGNPFTSPFGDECIRIVVRALWDVRPMADLFERTFEAEVDHTARARILLGIYTGISAPNEVCEATEVRPIDAEGPIRVLTFDIETDDRGAFPELGERAILSIVAHDSFEDEYVGFIDLAGRNVHDVFPEGKPEGVDVLHYYRDERSMLRAYAEWVSDLRVDLWTGWNIEEFDAPYVIARMKRLGLAPQRFSRTNTNREKSVQLTKKGYARIKGHTVYDLLLAYKRTKRGELKSHSLSNVAQAELGEDKIDHSGMGIYEMWESDATALMNYNAQDVRLVVRLDAHAGIIGFNNALRAEVGVDFEGTSANNQLIEMLVRRKLHALRLVGPTTNFDAEGGKYEGAFVVDAFTGIAENVVGMDLASLYPYTMAMLNSSPEVRVPESFEGPVARAPNGARFRLDQEGILTQLVDEAIELKAQAKADRNAADPDSDEYANLSERYDVRKTIVNSLYGVSGWERFFLYDEATAEAVTTMGQTVIKATQAYLNAQEGVDVIYGDTDSNYVRFDGSLSKEACITRAKRYARELNENVYPALATEWGMGSCECLWEIEVESYAERFFQAGKKKRYAMLVTWLDGHDTRKVKITGFDTNRSDTAQLTNDLQNDVLHAILDGADAAALGTIVHEYAKQLGDGDWLYIGIPQGIGKQLDSYATPTAHVRGAKYANALLGTNFGGGSKPLRVYVNPTLIEGHAELGEIDVLCFDEDSLSAVPAGFNVDVKRMTDVLVRSPTEQILEAVGVDMESAIRGQVQTGLDRFFGGSGGEAA